MSASASGVAGVSTIRPGAAASTTIRGRTIGTIISAHSAGGEGAARREQAAWYAGNAQWRPCSLLSQQRTFVGPVGTSVQCHNRTHAPQHTTCTVVMIYSI